MKLTKLFKLINLSGSFGKLAAGSSMAGMLMILNRATTLASGVFFARLLGVSGYGTYGLAIAISGILAVLAEMGAYSLVVRNVARSHASGQWHEIRRALRSSIMLSLIASSAIGVGGLAFIWTFDLNLDIGQKAALSLVLVLLPLNASIRITAAALFGLQHTTAAQAVESLVAPGVLCAASGLLLVSGTAIQAEHAMLLQILGGTCALSCGFLLYRNVTKGRDVHRTELRNLPQLAHEGVPFLLIGSAMVLNTQIDTIIVSAMLGVDGTGIYRVAAQGATLTYLAMHAISNVVSPQFARLHSHGDLQKLKRLFQFAQLGGLAGAIAVLLMFVFAGPWLIAISFGAEYLPALPLLIVLILGYVGNALFGPVGVLLAMAGQERLMARYLWVAALANLVGSTIAATIWGAMGVASMTALTITLYHAALRYLVRKSIGI